MALIVADTDVLIVFLAGREPASGAILKAREEDALVTTSVSRFELLSGAQTEDERLEFLRLLDALRTLPLDSGAVDRRPESTGLSKRPGNESIRAIA